MVDYVCAMLRAQIFKSEAESHSSAAFLASFLFYKSLIESIWPELDISVILKVEAIDHFSHFLDIDESKPEELFVLSS